MKVQPVHSLFVIVASSAVSSFCHPMMKVQPVHTASRQTKLKAKRLAGQQFNISLE